jgi:ribosome-associated heat shock protein Hsp15
VVKTRTLAQKLAVSGRVRINREKCHSASEIVKVDDVLTIALDRTIRILRVVRPGVRRGPPADARLLYDDLSPAPDATPAVPAAGARPAGSGRPTKRDQRRLIALKGGAGGAASGDDFPAGDD